MMFFRVKRFNDKALENTFLQKLSAHNLTQSESSLQVMVLFISCGGQKI